MRFSGLLSLQLLSIVFVFSLTISCSSSENSNYQIENCNIEKIKFDLTDIDNRGLIGELDNKVALDFEFCIPNKPEIIKEVLAINASLKTQKSKGRSNCNEQSILVIGNTYNKDFKKLLCKISQLEYVKEINQTYWE